MDFLARQGVGNSGPRFCFCEVARVCTSILLTSHCFRWRALEWASPPLPWLSPFLNHSVKTFQRRTTSPCPQTQKVILMWLGPHYSELGPASAITWELVGNAESQSPPQTYWPRIFIFKIFTHLAVLGLNCSTRFLFSCSLQDLWASQGALVVKNPPASSGHRREQRSIPGSGRSPGEGNGNPLQYSCLENPMDRGDWCTTVHGISKSWTRLKWLSPSKMFSCGMQTLEPWCPDVRYGDLASSSHGLPLALCVCLYLR